MTAEEVALAKRRELQGKHEAAEERITLLSHNPEAASETRILALVLENAIGALDEIIRAIRAEDRGDRMRASYEASVSEQVIHAETAWYDRGYEQGYEQGRSDALRGVQGALGYGYGSLVLAAELCPDCTVKPGQPLGPLCDYHDGVHEALARVFDAAEEPAR